LLLVANNNCYPLEEYGWGEEAHPVNAVVENNGIYKRQALGITYKSAK
jgi:hypothetical protein